jgi:hypothetical protein
MINAIAAGEVGGDRDAVLAPNRRGDGAADGAGGAGDEHDLIAQTSHDACVSLDLS